jgi:hypothetical protein
MDHVSPDDPEVKRLNSLVGYTSVRFKSLSIRRKYSIEMILKFILELQGLLKLDPSLHWMKIT